jgi:DNA repair protein RadC
MPPATDAPPDPATDASGHRARLRERLFEAGESALLDHELIEYLLSLSIKRQDTKGMARRLIADFGSYGAVVSADPQTLRRTGLGDVSIAALKIAQASAVRLIREQAFNRPVLDNWQAVHDYLHGVMAHRLTESARVLHLNSKNMLIQDEQVSEGSIDQTAIYVREVARRALELHSAALILVHNHPSGDPTPSRQDIALTREMVAALKPLSVRVHDHLIIGTSGHSSLRALGQI